MVYIKEKEIRGEEMKKHQAQYIGLGFLGILFLVAASISAMKPTVESPLDFTMNSIDGEPVDLADYKGKVVLMVNVASKCGLTPQYEALQALYEKYGERGLVILGFPANNFGAQEPGTNSEIKMFCTSNYGVIFPMFAKISVKGEDMHPLYEFLTSESTNPQFSGEIRWNFTKFLLDKHGKVIARFEPRTKPESEEVILSIEKALDGS